jgi:serine/threonine protein kinase/peptidoglycan hydrolase-like protein with peptidoglycan-binding domain
VPDLDPASAEPRKDIRGGLPVGTVLGNYELRSIIGKGAFGITYRARDQTLGRDVAVKEYLPTTLALREDRTTVLPISADHAEQFAWGRERFLEEARTLARLDRTPAIVRVYDFFEANGTAYMVMGLVEGENLNKRLLREGRLGPEAVERILFPLLDGLEEVHAIGYLHRDIKPANVMVDARGRPTLIDFGAARAAMAGRSTTMTAIFTPGYAAAEQYTSAELGPWTDIYGLAATLYHAITGKIPPSSIERILKDSLQPLSELKPEGYPPELLAGIDAGLERSFDDRPQSIAEWRHALRTGERQASAQQATQVEHKPSHSDRTTGRSRKAGITLPRPALWGAVAAAAVLLAGGGWLAFTSGSPPTTVGTAVSSLSAEQLEQALAERRKADTLAAEKRRLEEEARQRAQVESEAKRQADLELEQARQARQKAEQELAELKARIAAERAQSVQRDQAGAADQREAEEAAQRKAEADAAALRQAEEEARRKAEADAEAKRQAEDALAKVEAERRQAEEAARAKAEAEQAALRQASDEAQRKALQAEREKAEAEAKAKAEAEKTAAKQKEEGEAAERGLRLEQADRQRLQVALTSLGFDTRGNDGMFGPRTRDMIAAWQKKAGAPATGFLTAAQRDQLVRTAAPAVARWEEDQKRIEEQKKAEDEKKRSGTTSTVAVVASPAPVGSATPTQPSASAAPAEAARPVRPPDETQQPPTAPTRARISLEDNSDNITSCRFASLGGTLSARLYSDKIEMQMPWGWEVFKIDANGSFSGRANGLPTFGIGNTYTVPRFSIQGNVRSKDVRIESLSYYRCTWKGTIS